MTNEERRVLARSLSSATWSQVLAAELRVSIIFSQRMSRGSTDQFLPFSEAEADKVLERFDQALNSLTKAIEALEPVRN
jgi:hypothetical protein